MKDEEMYKRRQGNRFLCGAMDGERNDDRMNKQQRWESNVICRGVRVMNNNGSRSDDWIYCTFFVLCPLIISHTALSLIYTLSTSPMYTH
jgi:hypothetical protein